MSGERRWGNYRWNSYQGGGGTEEEAGTTVRVDGVIKKRSESTEGACNPSRSAGPNARQAPYSITALVRHLAELGLGHAADADTVCRLHHVSRKDDTVRGARWEDIVDGNTAVWCRVAELEEEANTDPAHDERVVIVAVLFVFITTDGHRLGACGGEDISVENVWSNQPPVLHSWRPKHPKRVNSYQ